jgi:WD40 repeat protein
VWNVTTGKATMTVTMPADSTEKIVAFSRDGRRVITVANDGLARLRRLPGGALIGTLPEPTGDRVDDAAFGPNNEQIVTGEDSGTKVWNAATRRAIFGVRMTSAAWGPQRSVRTVG